MITVVRFTNILLTGLIAGILVGIWLGYNPMTFSYSTYLEYQQGAINRLNVLMPILGLIAILLTVVSAFNERKYRPVFFLLLFAAVLQIACGLITKFGNQPLNAIVMTWTSSDPPSDWMELRERWWSLHKSRALLMLVAFVAILWAGVRKARP